MSGHGFERVEPIDDLYVLHCRCGWRSSASDRAEDIGTEWDRHRAVAGD